MPLFDDIARKYVLLQSGSVPDGAGGRTTVWTPGVEFVGRLVRNKSMEARKAEKLGAASLYTGMADHTVPLEHGAFFRCVDTGETYRVTSNPGEMQIPDSASPMLAGKRIFTAERAELPE